MNKKDIPQDHSALVNYIRELCYAVGENGNYETANSTGWEVKTNALDVAWKDIETRIIAAKDKVLRGEASPVLFYMELRLMDMKILSGYTGFWQWTIKRHMKPEVFKKLSEAKLKKYADVFEVSMKELKMEHFNADRL
ncbi:MAG: hypothetical protein JSS90_06780 [Bacteroidetes bacterium]|jgi:ribonucleotide monophosphatase NagD (HAD superfamily)|nr:hypothetical protein [Bacteroidota bacterium]